jgi:hypothetical protein
MIESQKDEMIALLESLDFITKDESNYNGVYKCHFISGKKKYNLYTFSGWVGFNMFYHDVENKYKNEQFYTVSSIMDMFDEYYLPYNRIKKIKQITEGYEGYEG